jgi:hypothetical protein
MPTAPRYTPSGVGIGNMPVPNVQPDLSGARGLAAVGDTLESLGRTVSQVQDTQERRAAYEAAQARARDTADDNAASEMLSDWKARADAREAGFVSTKKSETIRAYGDYTKGQVASVDEFVASQQMTPGVAQKFKLKASRQLYEYGAKADSHFAVQNRDYTQETQSGQNALHSGQAATALARGDNQAAGASLAAAMTSRRKLAEADGMAWTPEYQQQQFQELYADVSYSAYKLRSEIDKKAAVIFHQENKGKFGKYENDVAILADGAADHVWTDEVVSISIGKGGRDEFGNLSMDRMAAVAVATATADATEKERGLPGYVIPGVDIGGATPERTKMLEEKLKKELDKDEAARKAHGASVLNGIDKVYMERPDGWEVAKQMLNTEQGAAVLGRMDEASRATALEKIVSGPNRSNSEHLFKVNSALADPYTSPEAIRQVIGNSVLSSTDLASAYRRLDERVKDAGTTDHQARSVVWGFFKEPGNMLDFVGASEKEKQQAEIAADMRARVIIADVKAKNLPLSRDNLRQAYNERMAKTDKATSGIFSSSVTEIAATDFQPDEPLSETDLQAARTAMPGAPEYQQTLWAEMNRRDRRIRWADKMAKTEAKMAPKYLNPDYLAARIGSATTLSELEDATQQANRWMKDEGDFQDTVGRIRRRLQWAIEYRAAQLRKSAPTP